MIEPTVGRIVWFYESSAPSSPRAGIVAKVWNSWMVNLAVIEEDGKLTPKIFVDLLQDREGPQGKFCWCEWMPYQKGQAAKTEELEKRVA